MRRIAGILAGVWLAVACSSDAAPPAVTLSYGPSPLLLRAGEAASVPPAVNGTAAAFSVEPALPAGLSMDAATGLLSGVAAAPATQLDYVVRATVGGTAVTANLTLAVGPALPSEVAALESGFWCEQHTALPVTAAKMALAPDGRIFVTELMTGSIRVIASDGTLLTAPFATVPVLTGGHNGLLGIALSPDFTTDGLVFAYACTPAGSGKPDRGRLLRWRAVGDVGQDETVLVDDLPVSSINNGGALCFDASGMLLVTVGDTENPALSQSDASMAGKVLRVQPSDGGIPADNPDPASPVFAKGLRNTFALTVHPVVDVPFFADNGAASDDELNLLQPGRNYEWGAGGQSFGALTGAVLRVWPDVVVPTGLAFQDPAAPSAWPPPFDESLFVTMYDEQIVERFEMSGALRTDIDREVEFLRFVATGIDNTPVDVQRGQDGQLWVLTFQGVYRVDRIR